MNKQIEKVKEHNEILQKILAKVHEYYAKGEALTLSKLAKELNLTQYKLIQYLNELEIESAIKVLRHKKVWIILPGNLMR